MKIIILISFIFIIKNIASPPFILQNDMSSPPFLTVSFNENKQKMKFYWNLIMLKLNEAMNQNKFYRLVKRDLINDLEEKQSFHIPDLTIQDFGSSTLTIDINEPFTIDFYLGTANNLSEYSELLKSNLTQITEEEGFFHLTIIGIISVENSDQIKEEYLSIMARPELRLLTERVKLEPTSFKELNLLEEKVLDKDEREIALKEISRSTSELMVFIDDCFKHGIPGKKKKISSKIVTWFKGENRTSEILEQEYILFMINYNLLLKRIFKRFFKDTVEHDFHGKVDVAKYLDDMIKKSNRYLEIRKLHKVEDITKEFVEEEKDIIRKGFKEFKKFYKKRYSLPIKDLNIELNLNDFNLI